jgi:hypothetical protein
MTVAVHTSTLVKVKLCLQSDIYFGTNVIDGILSLYLTGDSEISCGDYPKIYNDGSKITRGNLNARFS